jgi:hypothetical protein
VEEMLEGNSLPTIGRSQGGGFGSNTSEEPTDEMEL